MSDAARLAFSARRNQIRTWTMCFVGVDWSASTFAMQVRPDWDTPGAPLLALGTVGTASAKGLKVVGVTVENGKAVTTVTGRIDQLRAQAFSSGEWRSMDRPGSSKHLI